MLRIYGGTYREEDITSSSAQADLIRNRSVKVWGLVLSSLLQTARNMSSPASSTVLISAVMHGTAAHENLWHPEGERIMATTDITYRTRARLTPAEDQLRGCHATYLPRGHHLCSGGGRVVIQDPDRQVRLCRQLGHPVLRPAVHLSSLRLHHDMVQSISFNPPPIFGKAVHMPNQISYKSIGTSARLSIRGKKL